MVHNHRDRDHKLCVSPAQMVFTLFAVATAQTVLISCNSFSSSTRDRWGLQQQAHRQVLFFGVFFLFPLLFPEKKNSCFFFF